MGDKKQEWFFLNRYVVPAEFEQKMESMAAQGWITGAFGIGSSFAVIFHKKEPKQYKFVCDFRFFPGRSYRQTYRLQGWEYLGRASNCHYWRKEYTGEKPASFLSKTEEASRDQKLFYVLLLPFILLAVILFSALSAGATGAGRADIGQIFVTAAAVLAAMIYVGWALLKLRTHRERAK